MSHFLNGRSFQFAAILLAAFMVLIVNREFGVADNGDFYRYMGEYASKPINEKDPSPKVHGEEWKFRFFNQPVFYWAPEVKDPPAPWFSSASLFWMAGNRLGEVFFSPNVFNMRYTGLPFFLIQFFSLFYLFKRIPPSAAGPALMLVGTFWIMTDARITAFYNSFYAESVPILALFLLFVFFAGRIFSRPAECGASPPTGRILLSLVLIVLLAAVFAKRQYLYFVGPVLLFVFYCVREEFRVSKKAKIIMLGGFCLVVVGGMVAITGLKRAGNPEELNASRFTSYHALYYGLLPHSKRPLPLLAELGLPAESAPLIGKSAWNPASMKLVAEQPNINIGTFLKAIALEPRAFVGSVLHNAGEVGNFAITLGMVHGEWPGYPPVLISGLSTGFTKIAGAGLFWGAILVAVTLIAFPIGVAPQGRFPSRLLILTLLVILVSDVLISTFDGQQEARKHVLVGSVAAALIVIHGVACVAGFLFRGRSRA